LMAASTNPLGTLYRCKGCRTKTFSTLKEAQEHANETGHILEPLIEVT